MISPKLFVFALATGYFTFLIVDWYQSDDGITVTETVGPDGWVTRNFEMKFSNEALDAVSADDIPKLPALAQKIMCSLKLLRGWHAYQSMDNITKSDFTQLCKNVTEVDKCYANAGSGLGTDDWSGGYANADSGSHPFAAVFESLYDRIYECNKPIFKTALRLCKLTYEDAMDARNCYDNAIMQFSGSAEEAACRRKCCHDPSTFNASEPMLCGPGRDILASEHCQDPFLDQALKDNACQTSCAVDALNHYAGNFCNYDAALLFNAYQKDVLIKYVTMDECFETCPPRG